MTVHILSETSLEKQTIKKTTKKTKNYQLITVLCENRKVPFKKQTKDITYKLAV